MRQFGKIAVMPRITRVSSGGMLFHVLNRGVGRMQIFRAEKDYDAFHRVVEQTLRIATIRICAYCWMPNQMKYVNQPQTDAEVEVIRRCFHRGSPYGDAFWIEQAADNSAFNRRFVVVVVHAKHSNRHPIATR
jgi:REP element-mobilizing transposase RayT